MWLLRLKGGIELVEAEVNYWDNVPPGAEIEAAALAIPTATGPYIVELAGYEEYCIARIGTEIFGGGADPIAGYSLYGAREGSVFQVDVLAGGMRLKSYRREQSDIPSRCWRQGVR